MAVRIYRSTDLGAGNLTNTAGSLTSMLKKCLVDGLTSMSVSSISRTGNTATVTTGSAHQLTSLSRVTIAGAVESDYNGEYVVTVTGANTFTYTVANSPSQPATGTITAKIAGAGWTVAVEDSPNKKIIFRNYSDGVNGVDGSGRYFWVKDDGYQYVGQSSTDYTYGVILGCNSYNTIDSFNIPFPRTIVGTDRHSTTWYGCPVDKGQSTSHPWILIADNRTCYLIVQWVDNTAISSALNLYNFRVNAFGDFGLLGNVGNNPKAFVWTDEFNSRFAYSNKTFGFSNTSVGYMEHSLDQQSASTKFTLMPSFINAETPFLFATSYANCQLRAMPYPSPITGGAFLERAIIADDTNNVVRVTKHTHYEVERFAWLRGMFGTRNTTLSTGGTYKICDNFSTINLDNRDYLFGSCDYGGYANHIVYAIDLTGPW